MPDQTLTLEELRSRFQNLASVAAAQTAIGVLDPEAARYARALEYGSIAGGRPWPTAGPRTTVAVDPDTGAQVVVSTQAPQGFIRVRATHFLALVGRALQAPADWLDGDAVQSHIVEALQRAAQEALEGLRASAPRDSGRLAESLGILSE